MSRAYGPYPAIVNYVHDGDTVNTTIDLGFGLFITLNARIYGINAPELSTDAGKEARDFAETLLPKGCAVNVTSYGWDKYGGRYDATVLLPDATSFGQRMIDAGHAVAYPT